MILIHGGGAIAAEAEWDSNLDVLACNYRIYAPDLVGYGKTDKPRVDYTMSFFNKHFEDFVTVLGLERASLLGHSLGGGIALSYAVNNPAKVDRLVLVASAGLSNDIGPLGKVLFPIFKLVAKFKKNDTYLSLMTSGEIPQVFMDRLHDIKAPTLLVWGKWDGYVPVKLACQAHERLPNSMLHVFKRSWHSPHRQRSEEFNRLAVAFLNDCKSSAE